MEHAPKKVHNVQRNSKIQALLCTLDNYAQVPSPAISVPFQNADVHDSARYILEVIKHESCYLKVTSRTQWKLNNSVPTTLVLILWNYYRLCVVLNTMSMTTNTATALQSECTVREIRSSLCALGISTFQNRKQDPPQHADSSRKRAESNINGGWEYWRRIQGKRTSTHWNTETSAHLRVPLPCYSIGQNWHNHHPVAQQSSWTQHNANQKNHVNTLY